jgi:hypothetical protein
MDEYDDDYLDEYKAVERAGYANKLNELVVDIEKPTADERFLVNINGIVNSIIQNGELTRSDLTLSYGDLDKILDKAGTLPEKKFKNPLAYILGYLCINDFKQIDLKKFRRVSDIEVLKEYKTEAGVYPPDILRYARFWVKN